MLASELWEYLVLLFKQQFLIFKQYSTYFYKLFLLVRVFS